jgi:deazaflavin-dependent oxidoreductase (nitroreductase family)
MPEPRRRQLKWWERSLENFARSRPGGWLAINVANPIDKRLLAWSNGRVGLYVGQQVGLLEHVGAKSGLRRVTPLLYLADDGRIVLVASKAGAERNPAWYHNLKANPEVEFLPRGGPKAPYLAREAEGEERDDLWHRVNDLYVGYDDYQARSGGRRIPVMVLEPMKNVAEATGAGA